ncbi:MAG: GNAT family N-acetyltransferase [TACK group archaeon]|nr:GNAT family N-acetyltransferase [TACK group archaeon]
MSELSAFAKAVIRTKGRGLVVLMGDEGKEEAIIDELVGIYGSAIRIGSPQEGSIRGAVTWEQLDRVLGLSSPLVVISARVALDANALAAGAGLVKAKGLLVLLLGKRRGAVPSSQALRFGPPSPFVEHVLESARSCAVGMGYDVERGVLWKNLNWSSSLKVKRGFKPTPEQQTVIDEMKDMAKKEGSKVLIVRGDRGRGKSAALGLGAAAYVRESRGANLVVISKRTESLGVLFDFFERASGFKRVEDRVFRGRDGSLRWMPIDLALIFPPSLVDLVIVDEAAEFPIDALLSLVRKFKKIVFATTVQGYEGSGRGFELRFAESVKREARHAVAAITLMTPIRFMPGDPLERWAQETLLLKPELPQPDMSSVEIREIPRDFKVISDFYSILAEAHYRNEPNDLAAMMDLPNRSFVAAYGGGRPLGIVELSREGPLSEGEVRIIEEGGELPGNLIPDKLIGRSRMKGFERYWGQRIVRIAVHPAFQRRGVGTSLLSYVEKKAMEAGAAWVGASFSVDKEILSFWVKNGYVPAYISWKAVRSAGSPSAIVIKPLERAVEDMLRGRSPEIMWHWIMGVPTIFKGVNPEAMALCLTTLGRLSKRAGMPIKGFLEQPLESSIPLLAWAARAYSSSERPRLDLLEALLRFLRDGEGSRTDKVKISELLRQLYGSNGEVTGCIGVS